MTEEMTKTKVQAIMKDMEKALKEIEKKHGVKITRSGNVRFSDIDFNAKFKVEVDNQDVVEDKEREKFELYAKLEGFNPDGFGKTINDRGLVLKVIGFNTRAPKNPIRLEDENGRKYRMSLAGYKMKFPL